MHFIKNLSKNLPLYSFSEETKTSTFEIFPVIEKKTCLTFAIYMKMVILIAGVYMFKYVHRGH